MRVLITGGTGSLGSLLVEHFITRGDQVTILSRDPHKQAALLQQYPQVHAILGDICDEHAVEHAVRRQEVVVHAAALKRIERGTTDPEEYIRVNTLGAQQVLRLAYRAGVQKCLLISSDKCVDATSLYGITKRAAEFIYAAYPIGAALRYGNVMDSQGSVWWAWTDALQAGRLINLRVPDPTRFFLLRKDAVQLVQETLDIMQGGEIFVPHNLSAVSMESIAQVVVPDRHWLTSPLLPGEKQHEVLVGASEHVVETIGRLARVGQGLRTATTGYCSLDVPRISGTEAVQLLMQATCS